MKLVRLAIAPVEIGQGRKLFPDGGSPLGFRPISHDTTPTGLAALLREAQHVVQRCVPWTAERTREIARTADGQQIVCEPH